MEWGEFKACFEHNPNLDTLTYRARDCQSYEHPVVGTNLIVIRELSTDKIVGFTVGRYSEHEHHDTRGTPM